MSTVKNTSTATSEPLISDSFLNFSQTIKSPKTRANYIPLYSEVAGGDRTKCDKCGKIIQGVSDSNA